MVKLLGKEVGLFSNPLKKELQDLQVVLNNREQQLKHSAVMIDSLQAALRPMMDFTSNLSAGGIQYHRYPYSLSEMYETFFLSDTLFTCANARTKAVFRNGYETAPVFVRKCPECLTEYQSKNEECDTCGTKTVEPDEKQRKNVNLLYEAFMTRVNSNGQNIQVIQEIEDTDLNAIDDMFMLTLFNYEFSGQYISSMTPVEILRADPRIMKMIADKTGRPGYDEKGMPVYACVVHRIGSPQTTEKCSQCGKANYIAKYVALNSYGGDKNIYYFDWEVIHESKFHPSLTYGMSNVHKVWRKVHALMAMDKFIQEYYEAQRMPRSAVIFDTNNIPDLKSQISDARDKHGRNSAEPVYLGVTRDKGAGPVATVVELMKPLDEMQYIEAREEMRRTIGAAFGVQPIFQGDMSASGGLNNEGLQITVTNQVIETDQQLHNRVLKKLVRNFGITDFTIRLKPHEEKDEMAEIQRDIARADHALRMQQLGFNVKYTPERDFEFQGQDDGESHKDVEEFFENQSQNMNEQNDAETKVPKQSTGDKKFAASYSGSPAAKSLSKSLYEIYNGAFKAHGDTPRGVGWKDAQAQTKRFDVFLDVIKGEKYPKILDVGCGTGHLRTYMQRKGMFPIYKGIDINHNYISKAVSKGIRAEVKDIDMVNENYDYIFSSGVHNTLGSSDPVNDMEKLFAKCNKALVMNMLKKSEGPALVARDKEKMLRYAKFLTPDAEMKEGYLDNDFTLILRKGYKPKETKQQMQEAEEVEDELTKELKKILGELKFHHGMSQDNMRMAVKKVAEKISNRLRGKADSDIRDIYKNAMDRAAQEMNMKIGFTQRDEHAIGLLKNDKIFVEAFDNVEKDVSKKLNIIIASAYKKPEEFTIDKIVKRMKNVSDESEGHLTNISRTETNHISNLARENSYAQVDTEGKLLYKFINPLDDRTTDVCKNIVKRTQEGVTLAQMKAIIAEESASHGFMAREFTPHYQCRSTFIKVN